MQTDGVNFSAAWANDDLVDCPRLKTNDVYAMLLSFGVEAGAYIRPLLAQPEPLLVT